MVESARSISCKASLYVQRIAVIEILTIAGKPFNIASCATLGFRFEDFTVENYDPHPHINAQVAI
jgi:thymidylate synthase